MKPCLNQDTLRTTPTDRFLEIARQTDFEAVELTIDKIEPIIRENSIKKLREAIQDQGLTVASINGPENFNLLNDAEFSALLKRTKSLTVAAGEIDCKTLVPVPSAVHGSVPRDIIVSRTASALKALAKSCGDQMNLAVEFLGVQDCSVNRLGTAVEVVERVAQVNVGLAIDSFHMHLSESSFSDLTNLQKGRILIVHVNDSEPGDVRKLTDANRLGLGEGVIDLGKLRLSLEKMGYDGFLSLELLRPSYWRQDPVKVARKGREAMRMILGI